MSVLGMAREVATAYGLPLRRPAARTTAAAPAHRASGPGLHLLSLKAVEQGDIEVTIDVPDLCPRYAGALADVTVGESPGWMQERLRAVGVRPISNIVDVTNYVLLELGQPMHAFDRARLGGGAIRVRTARSGETIRTLDGQLRELASDMMVIADAERPVAVAGVMGGADSEVTGTTTAIVLESAYFNPLSVRRTSKRLGLKTEASMRFERGADPRLPVTAMERACALLETIGAGRAHGSVIDRYPLRIEPRVLRLRRDRLAAFLGLGIPDADVRRILDGLGFALRDAADGSGWEVTAPTRRVDVLREIDLIEEVARHFGFDRIPTTFPALASAAPAMDPRITKVRQLRTVLTGAGFSEAVTFGFTSAAAAAQFAGQDELVPIANPLSETFAVLRPSLLPGLIDAVAHNRRREQRDIRLFEIGARFRRSEGERRALACAWTGDPGGSHWSDGGRDVDFFDIKGLVERVCETLAVPSRAATHREEWLTPGRAATVVSGDTCIGVLGQLSPSVAERHGLPGSDAVYVAEINLDAIEAIAGPLDGRIQPLPRYPSVTRDISILVDAGLAAEEIRQTVRAAAPQTLIRLTEFDRYQGKGIPEDKVSLSLRLVFRSADRTLTDLEVQSAMDDIVSSLRQRHGAVQR
jgi:phenylalanyl-tRNA synthetase beta chain